ncbi:MAG TPA: response regulator transcription factor [Bryobacteraceae bacterium]|jgi:DNA-binding NarL/FixJ family response regulator|nr:response regulator transcription factor [Bryobacteraceae bacterium]
MKANRATVSIATARGDKPAEVASASIRIVVIEDQTLFRDGLTTLLSGQEDLEVVGSTDSLPVAVEHIRKVRPDIVLVGWPASSTNSQKVFAAIHEAKATTRVIMLVKEDAREDFVEAVRLGCSGIVPKQTSTELLLKSIRKVHAGEFWLDRMTTADVIRRLAKKGGSGSAGGARLGLREHAAALSQRELEIVVLVARGFKNKEMAERMFISEQTVKNHLHNIFDKLGVSDRLELALYAIHNNLHEAQ